jgi:hypothetical protein
VDRKISASRHAGGGGSHDVSEITAAELAVFRLVETVAAPDIGRRRGARVVHCRGEHCTVESLRLRPRITGGYSCRGAGSSQRTC